MNKAVVAGGSGFIGTALLRELKARGWETVVLHRSATTIKNADRVAAWDGKTLGPWQSEVDGATAVINLAGATINTNFTEEKKKEIRSSRVDSTTALGKAIAAAKAPPSCWINNSATGYYGNAGEAILGEGSPKGKDFLASVCADWEGAQNAAETPATRKVKLRLGIVLGPGGGAFEALSKLANLFLGSAVGTGRQWMSWIHMRDLVRMYLWALENPEVKGVYNASSPNPVRNEAMMAEFRRLYGRPPVPPVPGAILKLAAPIMKIEPEVALASAKAMPVMAQAKGFKFEQPDLRLALDDILGSQVAGS